MKPLRITYVSQVSRNPQFILGQKNEELYPKMLEVLYRMTGEVLRPNTKLIGVLLRETLLIGRFSDNIAGGSETTNDRVLAQLTRKFINPMYEASSIVGSYPLYQLVYAQTILPLGE